MKAEREVKGKKKKINTNNNKKETASHSGPLGPRTPFRVFRK